MMKKIISLTIIVVLSLNVIGCETRNPFERSNSGNENEEATTIVAANSAEQISEPKTQETEASSVHTETAPEEHKFTNATSETGDDGLDKLAAMGDIETKQKLFDVEFTVPKDFLDEGTTQKELDEKAKEGNYQSAKLNDDGSVTYTMSKEQHKKMLDGIVEGIDKSLNDLIKSEDYSFTKIDHNDSYTSFKVFMTNDELSMGESFSVLQLYMLGGMYGVFSGERPDNVHVEFVNENTGNVNDTSDSKDMGSGGSE